ncbi:beta-lactamase/transpeptidase-like protein [Calycina marina]|uniref:Beta-lactamase/transpeptidase-like protein n=1 Tax=Calycina marina TaxID=1763456 RepID=A0A9P7Z9J0_9HELO|nr:beta-lactamase/transpeptidase-like protein [Calycina marina]
MSPSLDPDCTMSLTSAGKFVTNIGALQLVERDILTPDEPVQKYLPEIEQCLLIEEVDMGEQGSRDSDGDGGEKKEKEKIIVLRRPTRDVTLRDLLINKSGMGPCDTYIERFGSEDRVPPLEFPNDNHLLVKSRSTRLFFEPGESFDYGWGIYYVRGIYYVQLLVERLGGNERYVQYANEHIFGTLGMTASTYVPAQVPHIWTRHLQMVERRQERDTAGGNLSLVAKDKETYGLTCSMSDLARLFGDKSIVTCCSHPSWRPAAARTRRCRPRPPTMASCSPWKRACRTKCHGHCRRRPRSTGPWRTCSWRRIIPSLARAFPREQWRLRGSQT